MGTPATSSAVVTLHPEKGIHRVPNEIWYMVCDELTTDKDELFRRAKEGDGMHPYRIHYADLLNLATACRFFCNIATRRLYSTVFLSILHTPTRIRRLRDLIVQRPELRQLCKHLIISPEVYRKAYSSVTTVLTFADLVRLLDDETKVSDLGEMGHVGPTVDRTTDETLGGETSEGIDHRPPIRRVSDDLLRWYVQHNQAHHRCFRLSSESRGKEIAPEVRVYY